MLCYRIIFLLNGTKISTIFQTESEAVPKTVKFSPDFTITLTKQTVYYTCNVKN